MFNEYINIGSQNSVCEIHCAAFRRKVTVHLICLHAGADALCSLCGTD
jgi:hypothetical protein